MSENTTESPERKATDDEMIKLKKTLLEMPFEELEKVKEKIGLKAYRRAMFGEGSNHMKRKFKRENKNRPMEITSKKPVSRHKQVMAVKKKINRDPRFDDLSGDFDEERFKKSYSFLEDIKKKEKTNLIKSCRKETDEEKKVQMQYLIKRMDQQEQASKQKALKTKHESEIKKKEKQMVKEGKKPYYLKKSDKKTLELAEKYKSLKESGRLDKYLQKKRKKIAGKEKKNMLKH